ncbi:MAG: hypothetical protein P4M15_11115, partial [Alphaproteobacteria bacterium]|nr:hypothetical protein [Alphaproteobacteria bacterium]
RSRSLSLAERPIYDYFNPKTLRQNAPEKGSRSTALTTVVTANSGTTGIFINVFIDFAPLINNGLWASIYAVIILHLLIRPLPFN